MEETFPTPADRLEGGTPIRVWYGIVGAPASWVLLSSLEWLIVSRACADGEASWGPLSAFGVRLLLLTGAVAAILASAAGMIVARRAWERLSPRTRLTDAYAYGTAEYLAVAGVLVSAVFLIAIVWTALPAVMIDLCQEWR